MMDGKITNVPCSRVHIGVHAPAKAVQLIARVVVHVVSSARACLIINFCFCAVEAWLVSKVDVPGQDLEEDG